MSRKFLLIVICGFAVGSLIIGGGYLFANRATPTLLITDVSPRDTVHLPEVPPPPAPPKPIAKGVRLRLAIGSLGLADGEMDQQVSDLTLSELSDAPGLDMVERQSLDKALQELSLSLSGLVRAKDAIRVGKLVKADWFLLGTQAKIAGTNSIVLRMVDARTGILRDAGVIPIAPSPVQLAKDIAGFARQARQDAITPKSRVYLAIGAFEDLSANNRLADFAPQLRGYLVSAYRGDGRVTLLEREYADTLLQELELDLAGFTDDSSSGPPQPMQSAFWLVDGCYQSYQTGDREIEVTLEVHRMFGRSQQQVVHGASGEPVDHQIKTAIDSVLDQNSGAVFPTRLSEVRAQIHKGGEMAQLGNLVGNYYNPDMTAQEAAKLRRNADEAIRAFETALLLDPTNREAKMYLAACLRKQVIGKPDQARNYYREIIEDPVHDDWSDKARDALVWSFEWSSAGEKAAWFESAAGQTINPLAREFYNQKAKAARLQATLESGGSEAQALAEQRLFSNMTNNFLGNMFGSMGTEEFLATYGTNREAAARRLADLYPTLSARAPDLAPYFLAAAVMVQVDTNAKVVLEFQKMLDRYGEHPEAVFHAQDFWWRVSSDICQWSFDHKLYGMAVQFLEGKLRAAALYPHHELGITADDTMCLAFANLRLARWQKALDIFESFSNQPVIFGRSVPWGNPNSVVLTDREANYCRKKLGLPAVTNPLQFDMGKPLLPLCTCSTFAADTDGLWVGMEGQLRRLDFELRTDKVVDLPIDPSVPITAVCLDSSTVWIATAGAGLIEFDKASGTCHHYTVDDGLMMNTMSCLYLVGNVLWIGYGDSLLSPSGGGLGRLDLPSRKFTSFIPTIANGASAERLGAGFTPRESPDVPTRRPIATMAAGPNGDVWFGSVFFALRHYQSQRNLWEEIPQATAPYSLAIGAGKLYVGHEGSSSRGLGVLSFSFRDGSWQSFPEVPGLPGLAVTTITADGDDLWVGGRGYLALLDTTRNKVLNFAYVQAFGVDRIQVGGNYVWAQFGGQLYRAPLGGLN
jgi:tetratricopeptide (TPR) repeat protein